MLGRIYKKAQMVKNLSENVSCVSATQNNECFFQGSLERHCRRDRHFYTERNKFMDYVYSWI